jgi:hypothetical protein
MTLPLPTNGTSRMKCPAKVWKIYLSQNKFTQSKDKFTQCKEGKRPQVVKCVPLQQLKQTLMTHFSAEAEKLYRVGKESNSFFNFNSV